MPRSSIPARTEPKTEISKEVPKHNRPYTMKGSAPRPTVSREERHAQDFAKAVDHLKLLNSASAVETMRGLPTGLLEMYLLAEEVGQGREMILRAFPKAGKAARARYLAVPAAKSKQPTPNRAAASEDKK